MTKPITDLNDAFDLFFEDGTVRLRLKEEMKHDTLLDEKLGRLSFLTSKNLSI